MLYNEQSLRRVKIDISSATTVELVAAADVASNRRIIIVSGFIKSDAATNITLQDTLSTPTAITGPIPFGAGDGGPIDAILPCEYGEGLEIVVSATANVGGWITYFIGD